MHPTPERYLTGLLLCAITSCAHGHVPFTGPLPEGVALDLAGDIYLSKEGTLRLALVRPCRMTAQGDDARPTTMECDALHRNPIKVVADTPWGSSITGSWMSSSMLEFKIDWKRESISSADSLAAAWNISGAHWTPTKNETQLMQTLSGTLPAADAPASVTLVATDKQPPSASQPTRIVGAPRAPALDASWVIVGDKFHPGENAQALVHVFNYGSATAVGVEARFRSSLSFVHGLTLQLGDIAPGGSGEGKLPITVPASASIASTMVVVTVSDKDGHQADMMSRSVATTPSNELECALIGRPARPSLISGGQPVSLECRRGGMKATAANVNLISGNNTTSTKLYNLVVSNEGSMLRFDFDAPLGVVRGEWVVLEVDALNGPQVVARTKLEVKEALCSFGKVTTQQYKAAINSQQLHMKTRGLTRQEAELNAAEWTYCLP